jgi:crotonobetainyl-CoA:carnitine CoA-transferase CaiB-like acyl-CoA transferase
MNRLGLGYEEIKKVNPKIVYCSLTGFGHFGPDAHTRAGHPTILARSGFISGIDGRGPPQDWHALSPIGDCLAAAYSVMAILAAIIYRQKTGEGQFIDMAMLDCMVSFRTDRPVNKYLSEGEKYISPRPRKASRWRSSKKYEVPPIQIRPPKMPGVYETGYGLTPCKDGDIAFAMLGRTWIRFCQAIGREDLVRDPNSRSIPAEDTPEGKEFRSVFKRWASSRTCEEAVKTLKEGGVPVEFVYTIPMVVNDPHLKARDMFVKVYHPEQKREIELVGTPFHGMSKTPGRASGRIPDIGEYTEEVLSTLLGYRKEEIAKLEKEGVLK